MSWCLAMKMSCYEDTLLVFLLAFFFACLLAFLFACIQAFVPLRYALMYSQMHEPMHAQHCKPMIIRPICQDKGRRYCQTWCGRVPTCGSAPLSRSWWARGICSSPTSKAWLHTRPKYSHVSLRLRSVRLSCTCRSSCSYLRCWRSRLRSMK